MAEGATRYEQIAKECVEPLIKNYHRRAKWHRPKFRLSGIVVILIGAFLPLLAVFDYTNKELVVAVAGVTIAALTGLRTFYHWDQMWGLLRRVTFDLSDAYRTWLLEFKRAQALGPTEAEDRAYEVTKALLERVAEIRDNESEEYFVALNFPAAGAERLGREI